jgi:hypothetical protein
VRERPRNAVRSLLVLSLALLALAPSAGAAAGLRFTLVPQRAFQGEPASVSIAVQPAGARCSLAVRYANGVRQARLGKVRAVRGRAKWSWRLPVDAAIGPALVTASCPRVGTLTRSILVVGSTVPLPVDVVRSGFSIRPNPGGGTTVSYGVLIRNGSQVFDALGVSVLVNFVDGANVLFGSATSRVNGLGAGQTYALGAELAFPGAAPVDHLEIVVQVGGRQPRSARQPALANLRILASPNDPGYVGSLEGELINDDPGLLLRTARLSAVVLDAEGNILGGANGYALAALPAGTREFFKLTAGVKAIPLDRAASVVMSVEPTYAPAGS